MKTESHSINDVLAKNATSFFIPPFQRAYAWGKPEIERYFSDVTRIIDSELDKKQKDKLEHFFGTLVIKEEKAGFANKSVIVDGQQRLTTTLIFLIALRDSETEQNKVDFINLNFLTNNTSTFQDKIKLKQVTRDWDSYKSLVNCEEANPGVIKIAYELFKKLIREKKRLNQDVKFDHYIIAIQRMNVAVIFLDERPFKGEDPQIIFETLNSLGKPLSLSDLVRNTFNLFAYEKTDWIGGWTIFYWGWWLAWAPFVGLFIARISYGRTIREFVMGVLLIPSAFTLFWMTVFGNGAIDQVLVQGKDVLANMVNEDTSVALFVFLEQFPFSSVLSLIAVLMVVVFFVTSCDSGAMVVDMLCSHGKNDTPLWQRIYLSLIHI